MEGGVVYGGLCDFSLRPGRYTCCRDVCHPHAFIAQTGLTSALFPSSWWVRRARLFVLILHHWVLAAQSLLRLPAERIELVGNVAQLVFRVFNRVRILCIDQVLNALSDSLSPVF